MPSRYKDGAARSHGFRTPDNTCLERIRTGLQDLTGKEYQIEPASLARNTRSYMPTRYQGGAAGSQGFGKPDRTCLRGIRTRLQDLTGSEHQIVHA